MPKKGTPSSSQHWGDVLYLGSGQPLVTGLVLWGGSGFSLTLFQLGVVSQDAGVCLQHVVESMQAVGTADLRALNEGGAFREVEIFIGAHESQQLLLEGADLLPRRQSLVQRLPAAIQGLVERRGAGILPLANGSKLLQGNGA